MAHVDIDAVMQDTTRSVNDRVKIAILFEDGETDQIPNPNELADDDDLPGDFDNTNFINLTDDFNHIIESEKPTAKKLKTSAVKKFTKVSDCTKAITDAIK
ncbi:MAG: hypothetical protein JWR09_5477 [Mucilaginibacter sp.]|nr:hypothetical protein [Mucilaginibacter sp.]